MIEQLAQALDGVEHEEPLRPSSDSVESAGAFAELLGQLRSEPSIEDEASFEQGRPSPPPDRVERLEASTQAIIAPTIDRLETRIAARFESRVEPRFESRIAAETGSPGLAAPSPEAVPILPAFASGDPRMHEVTRALEGAVMPSTQSASSAEPAPIIPQTPPIERVLAQTLEQPLASVVMLPVGSRPVLRTTPPRDAPPSEPESEAVHEDPLLGVVDRQETRGRPRSEGAPPTLGAEPPRTAGSPPAMPRELQLPTSSQPPGGHRVAQPDRFSMPSPSASRAQRQAQVGPEVTQIDRASLAPPVAPVVAPPTGVAAASRPIAASGPVERVIPAQIEWLASQGGGTARVVLHPAALGEVEISVRVRGDTVEVAIRAQEPEARAALLGSRDRLDAALVARELRVESIEIRSAEPRPPSDASLADRPSFGDGSAGPESGGGRTREEARPTPNDAGRSPAQASMGSHEQRADVSRRVDLHV